MQHLAAATEKIDVVSETDGTWRGKKHRRVNGIQQEVTGADLFPGLKRVFDIRVLILLRCILGELADDR